MRRRRRGLLCAGAALATVDFSPIVRSLKAAGADLVFGAADTVDTVV